MSYKIYQIDVAIMSSDDLQKLSAEKLHKLAIDIYSIDKMLYLLNNEQLDLEYYYYIGKDDNNG